MECDALAVLARSVVDFSDLTDRWQLNLQPAPENSAFARNPGIATWFIRSNSQPAL